MASLQESQNITDPALKKKECIACKELINSAALVCPKCRSPQKSEKWQGIATVLKFVAGFTAVLSLIIVANEVTNLASHDRKLRENALEVVEAARLLWSAKDENSALSLLDKAEVIYPNLQESRKLRSDIGKSLISYIYSLSSNSGLEELDIKPDETGIPRYIYYSTIKRKNVESLLQKVSFPESLALLAGESKGFERARALAYMAWVEIILNPGINIPGSSIDIDIDKIFNQALEVSEDDAIVNLFRAVWLASSLNLYGDINKAKRLEQSKASFTRALAKCRDSEVVIYDLSLRRWIRSLQLDTLPSIEALDVVRDMIKNKEPLRNSFALTRLVFISLSGKYAETAKEIEAELINRYKPEVLVEVATELASIHFGCKSDGSCSEKSDRETGQMLFAIGRMYEFSGNLSKAHDFYQKAMSNAGLAGWWGGAFENALERTKPSD